MKAQTVWNAVLEITLRDGRTISAHFYVTEESLSQVAADVREYGLRIRPAEIVSVQWTPPWSTP